MGSSRNKEGLKKEAKVKKEAEIASRGIASLGRLVIVLLMPKTSLRL